MLRTSPATRWTCSLGLALAFSLPALGQTPSPAALLSPAEKAQRDAERVFDVIRFHTVKPAAPRPTATRRAPAGTPAKPTPPTNPAAPSLVAAPATSPSHDLTSPADATPERAAPHEPAGKSNAALLAPPAPGAAEPLRETDNGSTPPDREPSPEPDDAPEVPLTLQAFVPPALTPELQATLGAGARHVRVRVTVEADGRVSRAEAAAGVPRRLARPATEAVLQWQFTPLGETRTADVDLVFRRD